MLMLIFSYRHIKHIAIQILFEILTVAGPMIVTPFSSADLMSLRVRASGMPSAMIAIVCI